MTSLHKNLAISEIHAPMGLGPYANTAARNGATGLTDDDLYKFARQSDDNSVWMLVAHNPSPSWLYIGASGPGAHYTSHQIGGSDEIDANSLTTTGEIRIGLYPYDFSIGGSGGAARGALASTFAPALVYDDATEEYARISFRIPNNIDLSTTDPILRLIMAPAANQSVGDQFVFQANCKYVADGELFNKSNDETPSVDADVPTTQGERFDADITLDRTLMAAGDHFGLELRRMATDSNDDRNGNAYVMSVWFIADAQKVMES